MKIFIPKTDWQIPTLCASCGSVLSAHFIEKFLAVKIPTPNGKLKRKILTLRCTECDTLLREVRRSYQPLIRQGFWMGLLLGMLLFISMIYLIFLANPDRSEINANLPIGAYVAFILLGLLSSLGMGWAGLKVAEYRLFWGNKVPETLRTRIQRILKPVKVLKMIPYEEIHEALKTSEQEWTGYSILDLKCNHYAKALVEANAGEVLTFFCSRCEEEIKEEKELFSPTGWSAAVCLHCKKFYCPNCVSSQQPASCPDCNQLLAQAGRKEILAARLFSDSAANAFLGVSTNNEVKSG